MATTTNILSVSSVDASISSIAIADAAGSPTMVFCEELDFSELELLHVVGQGTFGIVKKALWRGNMVAVKIIEGESARKTFAVEVSKLARVKHQNIVTLYGACTKNPVCLVMEYAEGGSLHRLLHCPPKPPYKAAHAISWMLQCAQGVEYLHTRKPKALVHRDLKPLNLLLFDCGRKLKICDFGTACDLQTNMTNNKGSAQWMAPEVFEGSKYSEKCDVFSWGIMLWEVLTRRKPFEDVGGAAYRVMWAVHSGVRPPLIQNCPKPLEILMTRCWDQSPNSRPAMSEVVQIMSRLIRFFKGADDPIVQVQMDQREQIDDDDDTDEEDYSMVGVTISKMPTVADIFGSGPILTLPSLPSHVQDIRNAAIQQSAPASLAGSDEDVATSTRTDRATKTDGAAVAQGKGHRRTSSYDMGASKISANPETTDIAAGEIAKLALSNADGLLEHCGNLSTGATPDGDADVPMAYLALDTQFQPLSPYPGSVESHSIFREHCVLAEEYVKIQEEIALLLKRKQDLITELNDNIKEAHQMSRYQEYQQLLLEKEQLQNLHRTLKADVEAARKQRKA